MKKISSYYDDLHLYVVAQRIDILIRQNKSIFTTRERTFSWSYLSDKNDNVVLIWWLFIRKPSVVYIIPCLPCAWCRCVAESQNQVLVCSSSLMSTGKRTRIYGNRCVCRRWVAAYEICNLKKVGNVWLKVNFFCMYQSFL